MRNRFLTIKLFGCLLVIGAIFAINAKAAASYNTFLTDDCSPSKTNNFKVSVNCKDISPLQSTVPLIISEFRLRGPNPNSASNEFIEIYNQTNSPYTVAAIDASAGYGIAASDGVTRCTIPNGTVIPSRGHFLCVNSIGYSLGGYATGNATYTTDIPDDAGIALFNNSSGGASYSLANRFDAVGSTSEANPIYKEGTGYPPIASSNTEYSFTRLAIGNTASNADTAYPTLPFPVDTDNNSTDFYFGDTQGTFISGVIQKLGAPGPENLASPIAAIGQPIRSLLDSCVTLSTPPNTVRDFTSNPANNSTFGTYDVRRTFTNNSGVALTRLRFRILKLTTFPSVPGNADLRPLTSSSIPVTVDRPPCGSTSSITVQGTTLEQPPSQPNGGGWNSTMSAGAVTIGTPLAPGASIDLRFLFGVQTTGAVAIAFVAEGLPQAGALWWVQGGTDGGRVPAENSPTAANVSISGKVFDPNGNVIARAIVQMTDSNGLTVTTRTNTFGNYKFDGVAAGGAYLFNVSVKQYRFSPQIVTVDDQLTDLNFTANP